MEHKDYILFNLGAQLKKWRKQLPNSPTQKALAKEYGIYEGKIIDYEKSRIKNPDILLLAKVYKRNPIEFLRFEIDDLEPLLRVVSSIYRNNENQFMKIVTDLLKKG